MEEERHEVYERIPWENLGRQGAEKQWIWVAIAAAVAVGALAFSFIRNQPAPVAAPPDAPPVTQAVAVPPPTADATSQSPLVLAEADLYAVDPRQYLTEAIHHAERAAVEYFSVDGSTGSQASLAALMPSGLPPPGIPEGVQVFVDWAGARTAREVSPSRYEVEVVVRSLRSTDDEGFVRQPTRLAVFSVGMGDDGLPHVLRPPQVSVLADSASPAMTLVPLPAGIKSELEAVYVEVVGGEQGVDGLWQAVVMEEGVDGVRRPVTILLP